MLWPMETSTVMMVPCIGASTRMSSIRPTVAGGRNTVAVVSDPVEVSVSGRIVTITSPDKVFFTTRGDTKLDLVNYYVAMETAVMRQMADRPVLLQRFPNGAGGSNFFQKRIPDGAPEWLHTSIVQTPNGATRH